MSKKQGTLSYRRPPIVTVMGHIDHGKTTLLDAIRQTQVQKAETGGITQHIGAYEVQVSRSSSTKSITFIDTPGHAAFAKMRARGASLTDLVVLVVAVNDGIMAQTKECLDHINQAKVPFIVALNKMDLPGINPDKAKGQLTELGYTPEDYGGQLVLVPISASKSEGIDKLLDQILLHTDMLDLEADPQAPLQATIIESRLDRQKGPVAALVVTQGTLYLSQKVYLDQEAQPVRRLFDWRGQPLLKVLPGQPAEILGLKTPPPVGSILLDRPRPTPLSLDQATAPSPEQIAEKKLSILLKADTEGTLEALKNNLPSDINLILAGVGPVTETDIFLAQPTQAQIFAFNVLVPSSSVKTAEREKVKIFSSKIIYEILEELESQILKILEPTIDEDVHGEGQIIAEFKIKKDRIAGIRCLKGEIVKDSPVHLQRDGKIIKNTRVGSFRRGKDETEKIVSGQEAGLVFKPYVDFKVGDLVISHD